jgi:4-amino-4-deoxy-L-arabinose transferase-like glycosyltransferase
MWARFATAARTSPSRVPDALSALLIAILTVVVVHNAFRYSPVSGFDAEDAIRYAQRLVGEWRIPTELRNYYTPPGFFLLAGGLLRFGDALGMAEPLHLPQLLNGLLTVGTAVLLALLCAIVFPGRAWLRFAAVAFFVSSPIVIKTGAMFHPQPLVAFLSTLALVLAARMLRDRRYGVGAALLLGLVVGAGQLVRSAGVWTLVVVCAALLVAAVARAEERRAALRALLVVGVVGVLVALPWYVYLQTRYSSPVLGRGAPASPDVVPGLVPGRSAAAAPFRLVAVTPLPSRRLWFYVDPGLPEVITGPRRPKLEQAFWPVLYTDAWGDYFGIWKWGSIQKPLTEPIENRLSVQSVVGVLPTLLAAAGLFALAGLALVRVRSRPELVLVPLMPVVALAGMVYYAHGYPSVDGDTVKALFLLPAVPALAICFGFAVETTASRSRWLAVLLVVPLTVTLVVSFSFGIA